MIPSKPMAKKIFLLTCVLAVFSIINVSAQDGKALFQANCASCHNPFKDGTGPALKGLESRHKWADHKELLKWVNNPAGYMAGDAYTQGLKARFGSMMTAFPQFGIKEIDAIVAYINTVPDPSTKTPGDTGTQGAPSNQNAVIFGIISLILAIIALILMGINSNLKKLSDDAEGIERPEPIPFYRNKVY
ncbi:MAG: cytochrome c, partial [Chitinophagaceae bacterium]